MKNFSQFLESPLDEGINDPAIFKAIFLAGGPGSGKSFIVGKTGLTSMGYKVVNSDDAFEAAMQKAGLVMDPETIFSTKGQEIRGKAKALTARKQERYIKGRLGLVIDGTGKDPQKILNQSKKLKSLGYDVAMIFVNTDMETALERNRQRPRSLPDKEVIAYWKAVQQNIGAFQSMFGKPNFLVVDNSVGKDYEKETVRAYRDARKFTDKAVDNATAQKWISSEKQARGIKEEQDPLLADENPVTENGQDFLEEKLKVSDGLGAWIDDFKKSDAPQFKGKDDKKRQQMAVAAFVDAGGKLDERVFGDDDSILKSMMPDLFRWLDRTINKPIYKKAVRTFLDLRKKDPHNAERNLVKTAKIHGLDVRVLDKVFKDMVRAGKMPKHLLNYRGFAKEEYGAGFEGTPEATEKLKKDTPHSKVKKFKEFKDLKDGRGFQPAMMLHEPTKKKILAKQKKNRKET